MTDHFFNDPAGSNREETDISSSESQEYQEGEGESIQNSSEALVNEDFIRFHISVYDETLRENNGFNDRAEIVDVREKFNFTQSTGPIAQGMATQSAKDFAAKTERIALSVPKRHQRTRQIANISQQQTTMFVPQQPIEQQQVPNPKKQAPVIKRRRAKLVVQSNYITRSKKNTESAAELISQDIAIDFDSSERLLARRLTNIERAIDKYVADETMLIIADNSPRQIYLIPGSNISNDTLAKNVPIVIFFYGDIDIKNINT